MRRRAQRLASSAPAEPCAPAATPPPQLRIALQPSVTLQRRATAPMSLPPRRQLFWACAILFLLLGEAGGHRKAASPTRSCRPRRSLAARTCRHTAAVTAWHPPPRPRRIAGGAAAACGRTQPDRWGRRLLQDDAAAPSSSASPAIMVAPSPATALGDGSTIIVDEVVDQSEHCRLSLAHMHAAGWLPAAACGGAGSRAAAAAGTASHLPAPAIAPRLQSAPSCSAHSWREMCCGQAPPTCSRMKRPAAARAWQTTAVPPGCIAPTPPAATPPRRQRQQQQQAAWAAQQRRCAATALAHRQQLRPRRRRKRRVARCTCRTTAAACCPSPLSGCARIRRKWWPRAKECPTSQVRTVGKVGGWPRARLRAVPAGGVGSGTAGCLPARAGKAAAVRLCLHVGRDHGCFSLLPTFANFC